MNLAQTMRALGFNTVNAYEFDGLGPTNINNTLNANGLSKRSDASYRVGAIIMAEFSASTQSAA